MEELDLSGLPPPPAVWTGAIMDTFCGIVGFCYGWRNVLPYSLTEEGAWFSEEFRVPKLSSAYPQLLTYEDYLQQNQLESSSLQSIYNYTFKTSSTQLADLTTPTAAVVLLVVTFLLRRVKKKSLPFFSQFGREAARITHGPDWEANNEARIVKFGEYVFRLIFHSFISICGVVYYWDKDWWKPSGTKALFDNYPLHEIPPFMIWYYMIQSAYNLEAMLSLMELSFYISLRPVKSPQGTLQLPFQISWSPTVRGDFQEMFIHHLVTNFLVISSTFFRLSRVGSLIFLVHDLSDVPVDLSKLANFLKWKITTVVCFLTMVVVWMATRLGVLPFTIYRSVMFEAWMVCRTGDVHPILFVCYQHGFLVLIGLLIALHVVWFAMFIQMGYVLVSKGETHDLSEHKQGEDQPETTKTKKKD